MAINFHILEVLALWTIVVALVIITVASYAATHSPSTCDHDGALCVISKKVFNHPSYFQSVHIVILQFLMITALYVIRPWLRSRVWKMLERPQKSSLNELGGSRRGQSASLATVNESIQLSTSPGLVAALLSIFNSTTNAINPATIFVVFVGLLSIFTPLMVSPIYKSHQGGHGVDYNLTVGGGLGPTIDDHFDPNAIVASGTEAGRALVNTLSVQNSTSIPSYGIDPELNPFLLDNQTASIWHAKITVPTIRSTVVCDQSAYDQLRDFSPNNNKSAPVVTVDDDFWFSSGQRYQNLPNVTVANVTLAQLPYEPIVSMGYAASTNDTGPGWYSATTSVIFLAANGTLEGAQQRIENEFESISFTHTDIQFIDVLVCRSTVRIEYASCIVNQGKVISCGDPPLGTIPINATQNGTGGLETLLTGVEGIALTLAASPVWATYNRAESLPMIEPSQENLDKMVPALPFLTGNVQRPFYHVPKNYIINGMIYPTQHYLIQGFLQFWTTYSVQPVQLSAPFTTSVPWLSFLLLVLGFLIALVSTLIGRVIFSPEKNAELDLIRILAVSRNNPDLDKTFEGFDERKVVIPESVRRLGVSYGSLNYQGRKTLVLEDAPDLPAVRRRSGSARSLGSMKWSSAKRKGRRPSLALSQNAPRDSEVVLPTLFKKRRTTEGGDQESEVPIRGLGETHLVVKDQYHENHALLKRTEGNNTTESEAIPEPLGHWDSYNHAQESGTSTKENLVLDHEPSYSPWTHR